MRGTYAHKQAGREQGSVLFLTVLVIVIVLFFLAFQFDIGRLGISQVEHKRAATTGALSAMSAYWSTVMASSGPVRKRHDAGLLAAEEAAERILAFAENKPVFDENKKSRARIELSNQENPKVGTSVRGILRFGHWYFREPPEGCRAKGTRAKDQCPCAEGIWKGPCFKPLDERKQRSEFASAMQLEFFTAEEQPLRYLFASIFGHSGSRVRSRATVSLLSDAGILSTPRIVESSIIPVSGSDVAYSTSAVLHDKLKTLQKERKKRRAAKRKKLKQKKCERGSKVWDVPGYYRFSPPAYCSRVALIAWGGGGAASIQDGEGAAPGGAGGLAYGIYQLDERRIFDITVGSGGRNPCRGIGNESSIGGGGASYESIGEGGGFSSVRDGQYLLLLAGGGAAAGFGIANEECPGSADGGSGGGVLGESGGILECDLKAAQGGGPERGGYGIAENYNLHGARDQGGLGGGGGGYYGGGGSDGTRGGAAGGSGFVSDLLQGAVLEQGLGRLPAFSAIPLYTEPAAEGGDPQQGCASAAAEGQPGLVVLSWID